MRRGKSASGRAGHLEGRAPTRSVAQLLRQYAKAAAVALFIALLLRLFLARSYEIPSSSMLPTLLAGDQVLVSKLHYGIDDLLGDGWTLRYRDPLPGEVIVFSPSEQAPRGDLVKRVVAVAGEVVEIRNGAILVNGEEREIGPTERRIPGGEEGFGPVRVPPGHLFVMGDHREYSDDSRHWGFVDLDDVEGKVVLIYWSWDRLDRWVRWNRIGRRVD